MNKSNMTNIISLIVTILGYAIHNEILFMIGVFAFSELV